MKGRPSLLSIELSPPKAKPSGDAPEPPMEEDEGEGEDEGGDMAAAKLDAAARVARAFGLDPDTLDLQEVSDALEEHAACCSYEED